MSFFFYETINFVEVSKENFGPKFTYCDFGSLFDEKLSEFFKNSYLGYSSKGVCCYKTKFLVCKNSKQSGAKITSLMEDLDLKLLFKLTRNNFDTVIFFILVCIFF